MNYPTMADARRTLDLLHAYGNRAAALPFTAFVDRQGTIRDRHTGELNPGADTGENPRPASLRRRRAAPRAARRPCTEISSAKFHDIRRFASNMRNPAHCYLVGLITAKRTAMASLLLLNGANLNLLGTREPEVYGHTTLADVESDLTALAGSDGHRLECFQSNAEHELVERIHRPRGKASTAPSSTPARSRIPAWPSATPSSEPASRSSRSTSPTSTGASRSAAARTCPTSRPG